MNLKAGLPTIAFIVATVTMAFAHSGADGIVKERMEMMKSIAEQMKSIEEMIKGRQTFAAETLVSAAQAIASHADEIPDKFPEGSLKAPSEAHPLIWDEWDTFIGLADDLKDSATALVDAASMATDASTIRPDFLALGKTCLTCHEDFRTAD